MLDVAEVFELLAHNKINFFCGVPDSLLKSFCAYITDHTDLMHHTITANEGNAIGLAAGHYLATGDPALVYMQNSGLGNCVNPLLSLMDKEVYNLPVLMFIGWRGEPGIKDEPQHIKQGRVTDKLLDAMEIEYAVLSKDPEQASEQLLLAMEKIKQQSCPYAFLIQKETFAKYSLQSRGKNGFELAREQSIEIVLKQLTSNDVIVSTTGMISREVYEIRDRQGLSHKQDFLTVGSMGHSSSIALGIAMALPHRNIYCFDGDGSVLMHHGALTVNATKNLSNFKHIVFNNQAHDSVGGQPTAIYNENLSRVALECGYKKVYTVVTEAELLSVLPEFIANDCTSLLEIKVKCGARPDLGRPKEPPRVNKQIFMELLSHA